MYGKKYFVTFFVPGSRILFDIGTTKINISATKIKVYLPVYSDAIIFRDVSVHHA